MVAEGYDRKQPSSHRAVIRIEQRPDGVRLWVRVQPRSSRTELAGELDGVLKVRVAAPPVEGEANRELIRHLAKLMRIAPSRVRVAAGERGRSKTVDIEGVAVEVVRAALAS